MIEGFDVSSYQPEQFRLDVPETGNPIDFVIIKVTQGTSYVNPKWKAQLAWARQHDLAVGFYHFGEAGEISNQVAFFFNAIGGTLRADESLWFDWEATNGSAPSNTEKDEFIRLVKQARPGHRVGLYCNVHYWKNVDTTSYAGDGLWVAHWEPTDPPIEHPWLIHQYSTANGYDHNRSPFQFRQQMKSWAGQLATEPEEPSPATVMEAVLRLDAKLDEILRRLS